MNRLEQNTKVMSPFLERIVSFSRTPANTAQKSSDDLNLIQRVPIRREAVVGGWPGWNGSTVDLFIQSGFACNLVKPHRSVCCRTCVSCKGGSS
jgi:hypothetical protein